MSIFGVSKIDGAMSIFGASRTNGAKWYTRSESDKRWNLECTAHFNVWGPPDALKELVDAKGKELGIAPPDDLKFGCVKY